MMANQTSGEITNMPTYKTVEAPPRRHRLDQELQQVGFLNSPLYTVIPLLFIPWAFYVFMFRLTTRRRKKKKRPCIQKYHHHHHQKLCRQKRQIPQNLRDNLHLAMETKLCHEAVRDTIILTGNFYFKTTMKLI